MPNQEENLEPKDLDLLLDTQKFQIERLFVSEHYSSIQIVCLSPIDDVHVPETIAQE